ncbi:MAG TPA: glycoside hydrolase family 44 protein [Pirellulales bacterium]|nr:glycoside hydrolase family 44 protein [Pirellulales bacterium]
MFDRTSAVLSRSRASSSWHFASRRFRAAAACLLSLGALCAALVSTGWSADAPLKKGTADSFAGGVAWDRMEIAPQVKTCELIWVHPNTGAVYAFCNKGDIYLSTDDGVKWTLLTQKAEARATGMVEQVVLDPKNDRRLYVSSMYGGGAPFMTDDGGATWKPLGPGHVDYLAVDFSDPDRNTIITSKHETHNGFLVSHNAGPKATGKPSWEKIELSENPAFGSFQYLVDAKTWLLGTGGDWGGGTSAVYRTVDGGKSFKLLLDAPGPKPRSGFQVREGKYYYLSNKGISTSADQGASWQLLSTPPQPWTLAFGLKGAAWLVCENGLYTSTDDLKTWLPVSSSLKIAGAHYTVNPKTGTMYASSYSEQGLRHRGKLQDKPADLIVWSGDHPTGQTWSKFGPKGEFKEERQAGYEGKGAALLLHMDGDGYRGGGLNWKGWYPADACDDVSKYTALTFYIKQVSKVKNADLSINLMDNLKRKAGEAASNMVSVVADGGLDQIDDKWRRVVLPLNRFTLNKDLSLSHLWQIDFSNTSSSELTFLIDRIGFAVEKVEPPRFKAGAPFSAQASIAADEAVRTISDNIYGVCSLPREKLIEYHLPITRWGGNPSTRYNWQRGVDSAGSDWYFKNRGKLLDRLSETGYLTNIDSNQVFGATTYQTVPMIGWVAKDNSSYGFSVAKYGPQKSHEPGNPDVGNGILPSGAKVTGNDPRDTSVPAPPEFIGAGVRYVVKFAGKADGSEGKPGVKYWALDNEPMLWNTTHRDVFPEPLGYDELWKRTVAYAEAIKKADPTAKVAGFCSWGWTDLYYSAKDAGNDSYRTKSDWLAHNKMPLCEWFIKQCGDYQREHGKPLVDTLDIHWYPQGQVKGQGAYMGRGLSAELNEYRMRSTRDLWDRKYEQESWIKTTDNYSPVALIPRVQAWIAKHNPGMELSLGEYNFGGADNVSGGLAQADAFGIFAREGVNLAFIWYTPSGSQQTAWQLFRSYDGRGGAFGDQLLKSESANPDVAIYASRRSSDHAVTIALINKNLHGACTLNLNLGALAGHLRGYRFDQDTGDEVQPVASLSHPVKGPLELELPPASATMLVITADGIAKNP